METEKKPCAGLGATISWNWLPVNASNPSPVSSGLPQQFYQDANTLTALAAVNILEANDVVLPEVGTGLHFDHLQGHAPGILKPMRCAQWDES